MLNLQKLYTFLSGLSKRERFVFYAALSILSLAFIDRLIISPIFSKMSNLDKQIQERTAGIKSSLRILLQKERILAESSRYASFVGEFQTEEEEMSFFLKEIGKMADKNSIYIVDMKPRGVDGIGSSKKYLINLNCEAQMEQVAKFMYDIESVNKLLTIENYQIGPKSDNSSVAVCNIVISKIVMSQE